ncbi:hypothetical protein [Rosistilla oblonga]|uniref:hypothetical protein n=1 Tax=Rosistilla oblonga TaxID=2527990 RepID=UPI0018D2607D|nr:hypothetical protein [Rosistilla oblonga]
MNASALPATKDRIDNSGPTLCAVIYREGKLTAERTAYPKTRSVASGGSSQSNKIFLNPSDKMIAPTVTFVVEKLRRAIDVINRFRPKVDVHRASA